MNFNCNHYGIFRIMHANWRKFYRRCRDSFFCQLKKQDENVSQDSSFVSNDSMEKDSIREDEPNCGHDISVRIKYGIDLLKRIDSPINAAIIARDLGVNKIEYIDNMILGKECPTVDFIKCFASQYNINEEWLLSGDLHNRHPYSHCCIFNHDSSKVIEMYKDGNFKTIVVCTADNDERWTCIALSNGFFFKVIHGETNWRISDKVGGTGQRQLFSLYKTLKHFDAYDYLVRGIEVSTDEFCRLISGKAHIKEIEKHKNTSYM